jgi:hypothetical protein
MVCSVLALRLMMLSSVGSPMIGAVRLSWQCYGWRRLVVLVVM